ncbi:hypothetical protein FMUND_9543 [Fusarium mundagurra]|uniref:Uncharacterized protein n=1 Tax=Fusarium mundagurra TaxID=1567541 RepID=A0A8H5YEW1_9HYPO|nr:hypothetical protein FMUND_9543 [Fusarium mundagurra]
MRNPQPTAFDSAKDSFRPQKSQLLGQPQSRAQSSTNASRQRETPRRIVRIPYPARTAPSAPPATAPSAAPAAALPTATTPVTSPQAQATPPPPPASQASLPSSPSVSLVPSQPWSLESSQAAGCGAYQPQPACSGVPEWVGHSSQYPP